MTSKPHAKIPMDECLKTFKDKRDLEQYACHVTNCAAVLTR
jgi:hypothetical protein